MPRKKQENSKIEVAGVVTTKKRLKYAKEKVLSGGNKTEALKKAGYSTKNVKQMAHNLDTLPDVMIITNLVKKQVQKMYPLTMEEIKQLGTELATVSILDLFEKDGTIDVVKIKERGLGRFIKEWDQEVTYNKDGSKTVKTKVKGYDRIQALRMLSLVQRDEDNRNIQILQTLTSLFQDRPDLIKEKHRVFAMFAKRFAISQEKVEELFDKFGKSYLVT